MAMKQKETVEIIEPKNVWTGDAKAPLSLVMFGDYESDECLKAHDVVKQLLVEFEGKLRFNYRHFPLTQIHQRAHKAAEAAVAASQEGKFWEMHDLLFRYHRTLGTISLKEYARDAGVTDKNLLPKLVDSVYGWTVRNDLLEGLDKGVKDVPTFFINGELFTEKPTFQNLSKALEAAQKPKRKKAA